MIYRRRLQRSREKRIIQPAEKAEGLGIASMAELGGDGHVREIEGREMLVESDDTNARHELEGDWHGNEAQGM